MSQIEEIVPGNVKEVMRAHKTGVADVYMVHVAALRVREGFNSAREADPEYPLAVRELADSIKANGFFRHKPIKVAASADGFLYVSDGHTRYDAVHLANSEGAAIESVPVINEMRGTSEEDRIFGLILDNTGRKLTPLGEGMVIKQLIGRGIDEKEIARRLGFSITKVANALALVAAPAPIRAMVAAGEVSATTAVKTMKSEGVNAVATLEKAKETAKAAGKTKVTEKHLKPKEPQAVSDSDRLNWIISRQGIAAREWYREGQVRFWQLTGVDDEVITEGPTLREAIDAAMKTE